MLLNELFFKGLIRCFPVALTHEQYLEHGMPLKVKMYFTMVFK